MDLFASIRAHSRLTDMEKSRIACLKSRFVLGPEKPIGLEKKEIVPIAPAIAAEVGSQRRRGPMPLTDQQQQVRRIDFPAFVEIPQQFQSGRGSNSGRRRGG